MITALRKTELWGSALLAMALFLLIGSIASWRNFFPFVHWFNALSVITWAVALYISWTKSWNEDKGRLVSILVVVSALPHTICSLLSYGSMVCLGVSMVIVVALRRVR
jgi:hypothetical protein